MCLSWLTREMRKRKKPLNPYIKELLYIKKKDGRTDGQIERKNITERYSQEKIAILTSI
jgi:hypothetical protein